MEGSYLLPKEFLAKLLGQAAVYDLRKHIGEDVLKRLEQAASEESWPTVPVLVEDLQKVLKAIT